MEKDLKSMLRNMLENFNAQEICTYFGCEFGDDWDEFEQTKKNIEVMEYLNSSFIDIDVEDDRKNFDKNVKNTLINALEILD